jgi:hypothetical protein
MDKLLKVAHSNSDRTVVQALSAVLLMLATLGPLGVALVSAMAPLPRGPVAAIFPPWWTTQEAVTAAAAAGAVIRFGAFPFIVIILASDRAQLRSHGAWILLDPRAVCDCSPSAVLP